MKTIKAVSMVMFFMILMMGTNTMAADGEASTATVPTTTTSATAASAIMPDSLPMILSEKAMLSYAKESIARGDKYVGGDGIITGITSAHVDASDPDARKIVAALKKQKLQFKVADTENTTLSLGWSFSNAGNYQLFYGQNQCKLVSGPGGWQIPEDSYFTTVKMVDQLPIYLPGATGATAIVTEANGAKHYIGLQVTPDGYLFFPSSLAGLAGAGWKGYMAIYLANGGDPAVYDMATGEATDPQVIEDDNDDAIFDGVVFLDNPPSITLGVGKAGIPATNPMFTATFTASQIATLYAVSPDGEVAEHVVVRKLNGIAKPLTYSITAGQMLRIQFDANSTYDVWFQFDSWDPDVPVIPPYWGGGMG